ncbi:hypothetical protein GGR56DRAFT_638549 [Xylariaceae sp. FL0804]|nr:hypothetical protein GGR56DRAFT_638549 [Xylariaceae sp. FL0804]
MISSVSPSTAAVDGRQAVSEASSSRIVPKPVPSSQAQDPRRYQLDQMKKRYAAKQSNLQDGTANLVFQFSPSDPDFAFELDYLQCELQVPSTYPEKAAALRVRNTDIPRGFRVNIERGWDRLAAERQGSTLLALTNALDKNLEAFLSEQKAETITLVSFKDTRHVGGPATKLGRPSNPAAQESTIPPRSSPPKPVPPPSRPYIPEESYTNDQIRDAKARRATEIRQLESRMGRLPVYQKSADGIVYNLPLEPKRRSELPVELQSIQSVQLIVPLLYPLQALRVLLNEVESKDAEDLEEAFMEKAKHQSHLSLMSQLNYLSQNIHTLAKQAQASRREREQQHESTKRAEPDAEDASLKSNIPPPSDRDGRHHLHFIPRPPEWGTNIESIESGDSESDSWGSEDDSDEGGAAVESASGAVTGVAQQLERGTAISFPYVELHGIELLQVSILNVSAKCDRCRTVNDLTGLKPEVEKTSSCTKCVTSFTAKFRQEMVHANSTRAGFVDLSGCSVADMLPSTFVPTCAKCSTPSPGLVSVRGEVITNVCRECHGRFTFKIPEVRFMRVTHGTSALPPTSGPRQRQEKLGLHAGEPLPGRGACAHYRRSHRWFRFSCCGRVHACDRCHDAAEKDHANEWANRMICGWCSREQNYAVEACAFCGRSVIGRKGRGFWEGGKGTRDRTRMSRKDKRKFRRVGAGEAARNRD